MEVLEITNALIARGYFRSEIPPVITSVKFAEWCYASAGILPELLGDIAENNKDNKKPPKRRPEQYSAAEYGFRRRNMLIPNPINQLALARVIAKHWQEIEGHYEKSGISKSKQRILPQDTSSCWATRITRHTELEGERMLAMAGHSHILQTDIGRFFPSVYTHSIPWAIDGKDKIKADIENKTGRWSDRLDRRLRQCNDGQTSGIPIGPVTSHIVAEVLMSSIDERLQKEMGERLKGGYRHVDDYFLCFDSEEDAQAALAAIQQAAAEYELSVNAEKTKIIKSADYMGDSWQIQLVKMASQMKKNRRLDFNFFLLPSRKEAEVREWLLQFAARTFALAKKHPNKSVMKYALKMLWKLPKDGVRLKGRNWDIYQSILVHIMTSHPYTTDMVAQILRKCQKRGYLGGESKGKLSDAVSALIRRHAPLEHHSEVAWALWLAKVVGLDIANEAAKCLPKVNSGVCALLALDNMQNGRIKLDENDTAPWRKHLSPGGLKDRFWLLAYEAPDCLGDKSYIDDDEFFAELKAREVRFYDESKNDAVKDDAIFDSWLY